MAGIPEKPPRALSVRAIALGLCLSAVINSGEPYLVGYVHASPLSADFSTGAAIFLLFLLSLVLNAPLRKWYPKAALTGGELTVCYIMMIVACAIPSWGFTMLLVPWIVAPSYYATPENQWQQFILPRLPEHLFVLDKTAARQFFEGLQEGETIPWQLWVKPLLLWGSFILCFYLACICLMIILRKQWVQNERLSYPLAQLPLALVPQDAKPGKAVYCRITFWIGFSIPVFFYSLKAFNAYFPEVPVIPQGTWLYIRDFQASLRLFFYFEVIGLAFLLTADMAFSIWFFALVTFIEQGLFRSVGYRVGPTQPYSSPGGQGVSNQALGAMVVLVLMLLWRARQHLWRSARAALGITKLQDEEEEILPYWVAYTGLLLCGGYVVGWWALTGLGANVIVLGFWMLVLFVGLSRAVVQGGMAYARSPVVPAVASLHSLGTQNLGPQGVIGLALTAPYAMDTRTTVMTSMADGLRLAEEIKGSRRRLALAVFLTLVVSLAVAVLTVLYLPYHYGGSNLGGWGYHRSYHHYIYNWARDQMVRDVPVGMAQFGFMGLGAGIMLMLVFFQKTFYWWPLHPLGAVLGYTHPVVSTWFSVFLAWLAKVTITWIGGGPLYQKARPFFLGLAVGGFVTAGFWAIVHALVGHGAVRFTLG